MRTSCPAPLLHTLWTLALAVGVCQASLSRCPDGHFRDGHSHRCQVCSTCPVNQIIRRVCTEDSNTLCGPFSEFLEFHQAPRPSLEVGDLPLPDDEGGHDLGEGDTRGSDDNRSRKLPDSLFTSLGDGGEGGRTQQAKHKHQRGNAKWHRHRKGDDQSQQAADHGDGPGGARDPQRVPAGRGGPRGQPEAPSLHDPEEGQNQWKVLALALIVVLCVVCIFLIIFVFVICYMRSRRAHLKQVLYSADKGGGSRSPGGQRPCHSLHYLPVLTHAQTRAGTSAGAMTAPPGGLVDSSYLYSEDYDADHSGQTISTAKSSDYVYFKSPHNGNNVYDV